MNERRFYTTNKSLGIEKAIDNFRILSLKFTKLLSSDIDICK